MKSPHPKNTKKSLDYVGEIFSRVLLKVIYDLTCKFDARNEHFQAIEWQLKENTEEVVNIKETAVLLLMYGV